MAPLPPDPYRILGISTDAQIPEIRSAYRKLVLKCHPDKVQDPELKAAKQNEFQTVQQAYELLSDDRERQKYDDKAKLAELRKQFQNKANISTPRSTPKEHNAYSAPEPVEQTSRSPPPATSYPYSYSPSWDDEADYNPRTFETAPRRPSRQDASYAERSLKREAARVRERERERERDRRRKADDSRRADKEAKERRAEKRQRERQREADEKRRYNVESLDDELPFSKWDRKKPGGSKYEARRDRAAEHRQDGLSDKLAYAQSYQENVKSTGLHRAKPHHPRNVQPPAPTPPPIIPDQPSHFGVPEDGGRRAAATSRRVSEGEPRLSRERAYGTSSREAMGDGININMSPTGRPPAQFQRPMPTNGSSPPLHLPRTNSMPLNAGFTRPVPDMLRTQTFHVYGDGLPRGRERMQTQIEEESDLEGAYDRRGRDRDGKHRSSRRHRSPDDIRPENVSRYQVDGGRAKLQSSSYGFSRRLDHMGDPRDYYSVSGGVPVADSRPPMPAHESSYAGSGRNFQVRMSKAYGRDDVQYSNYHDKQQYRQGYPAFA